MEGRVEFVDTALSLSDDLLTLIETREEFDPEVGDLLEAAQNLRDELRAL